MLGIGALVAVGAFAVAVAMAGAAPRQGSANASGITPGWVSLSSTSPADILRAARATSTFKAVSSAPQTAAGRALRADPLGTPVLVHAYRPTPGMNDVWVIPVLTPGSTSATAGHVVMLLDFAYDPAHHRLRALSFAGPFVAGDPAYGQPFPRMSTLQALATFALRQPRGSLPAAALSHAQTELVYFPVNLDRLNDPQHPQTWTGGGQFPDLAVWRVSMPGVADTIIGVDGRSYASSQLPLVANAAPAPTPGN